MPWSVAGLMADMVATVKTVTDFDDRVSWMPPETSYTFGPWAYMEYGPAAIEQASDEVIEHTIEIHVCVPMVGNFDGDYGEYAQVVDLVVDVHRAFYSNIMVNGEAAIGSPGTINKPDMVQYGETRNLRCTLTMQLTTAEDLSALVSD